MSELFAKNAARKMRKELAELEAEQAKATCWGAAVGERGKRIDALRRELARQTDTPDETDTSAEAVDRFAPVAAWGRSFMQPRIGGAWVRHSDYATLAAERDALQSKLAKAVEALERIEDASKYFGNCPEATETTVRYAHETTRRLARATLAELKGQGDE